MFVRKLPLILLALVLVARGVHCLHVEAELCAYALAARSPSPPLADPSDADPNETGCLCKGALVTNDACPASELRPVASLAWLADATALSFDDVALADHSSAPSNQIMPPVSGRTMRALLASWQI